MKKLISIVLCALTLGLTTSAQSVDLRDLKKDSSVVSTWAKEHPKLVKLAIAATIAATVIGGGFATYHFDVLGSKARVDNLIEGTKNFGKKFWNNDETDGATLGYINNAYKGINSGVKKVATCVKKHAWDDRAMWQIISVATVAALAGGIALDKVIRKDASVFNTVVDLIYDKIIGNTEEAPEAA